MIKENHVDIRGTLIQKVNNQIYVAVNTIKETVKLNGA